MDQFSKFFHLQVPEDILNPLIDPSKITTPLHPKILIHGPIFKILSLIGPGRQRESINPLIKNHATSTFSENFIEIQS